VAYDASGVPLLEAPEPAGLLNLAASADFVAAALEPGIVAWLDPDTGTERLRRTMGGEPVVAAGGGSVWVLDRRSERVWRLADVGALTGPFSLPRVEQFVPDGERVWWASLDDTLLRGGERPVDLEVSASERGGMTVCAGSVWISVIRGLLRVGTWASERGPPMAAPEGPVRLLTCTDGVVAGGSGRRGLFVLDPAVDADVRHLDVDLGGQLEFLVGARSVVWGIPVGRSEARLVAVRPTS
jgi:hypothetical protein